MLHCGDRVVSRSCTNLTVYRRSLVIEKQMIASGPRQAMLQLCCMDTPGAGGKRRKSAVNCGSMLHRAVGVTRLGAVLKSGRIQPLIRVTVGSGGGT